MSNMSIPEILEKSMSEEGKKLLNDSFQRRENDILAMIRDPQLRLERKINNFAKSLRS